MFTPEELFDALFDRVATEKNTDALFGALAKNRALLHEKLCGKPFSLLYLEFPLAGEPGFDLHVIHGANVIRQNAPYAAELFGGQGDFLSWYGRENPGGDGLDMVYDLRDGTALSPMIYLKLADGPMDFASFFTHIADAGTAERFLAAMARLPDGWDMWYTGLHKRRAKMPLRLGSFLVDALKQEYAADMRRFAAALMDIGFPVLPSPAMRDKLRALFSFPVPIDVQLDLLNDGTLGDILGISLTTGAMGRDALAASFVGGWMQDAANLLTEWGVADARVRLLPQATFSISKILRSRDGERARFILSSHLSFVKVRFQGAGTQPIDAKAYICLGAKKIS